MWVENFGSKKIVHTIHQNPHTEKRSNFQLSSVNFSFFMTKVQYIINYIENYPYPCPTNKKIYPNWRNLSDRG